MFDTPAASRKHSVTAYEGPSSSVSSLGTAGKYVGEQHMGGRYTTSSSEEEEYYEEDMAYESDMSISSRRPSMNSVHMNKSDTEELFNRKNSFPSSSSPSTAAAAAASASASAAKNSPKAAIRQLYTSSKALKPKVKSFLRISKELQEEQSPLDFEIKHEAEITQALRYDYRDEHEGSAGSASSATPNMMDDDDDDLHHRQRQPHSYSQKPPSALDAARFELEQSHNHNHHDVRRRSYSDSESDLHSTPGVSMKRKAALMDESMEPSTLKRRAVSPGLSSPAMSPSINTKRSMKQMQDTSDNLQNMSL